MANSIVAHQSAHSIDIDLSHKGPATFSVGDRCIHRVCGVEVIITQGYQQFTVRDANGDIVGSDGARCSRRFGYLVQRADNGKVSFCQAGDLLDMNDRQRHLQLVWPPKPTPRAKPKRASKSDPFKSHLLKSYANQLDPQTLNYMREAITRGFSEGRTTQEIIATIRKVERIAGTSVNEAQAS